MDLLNMNPLDALKYLKGLPRPKPVIASAECRAYFTETVLPVCEPQALSELMRKNQANPRLMGFMDDGSMGLIDVGKAMGGFGDARTKQATSAIQQLAAILPSVRASVFVSEVWTLRENAKEMEIPKNFADHPDRDEAVMVNMLYYVRPDHTIMQLLGLLPTIKVLGQNTSPRAWRDTKFGPVKIIDPNDKSDGKSMRGHFIA